MDKKYKYDKLYMDIATRVAEMSYARRKKVGCIIVKDDRILSIGWNGTPSGFDNTCEDENCDGSLTTKKEVLHAEMNCLAKLTKSTESSKSSTMYVTLSPCINCAKLIIQCGIERIIFKEKYHDESGIEFLFKTRLFNHMEIGEEWTELKF